MGLLQERKAKAVRRRVMTAARERGDGYEDSGVWRALELALREVPEGRARRLLGKASVLDILQTVRRVRAGGR